MNREYATISKTGRVDVWCLKFLAREKAKTMDNFLRFATVRIRRNGLATVIFSNKL